jgi:hypothetical protein
MISPDRQGAMGTTSGLAVLKEMRMVEMLQVEEIIVYRSRRGLPASSAGREN